MLSPIKSFSSILILSMLPWQPIACAESNDLHQEYHPLQSQIQQLQNQLKDADSRITILEATMANNDFNSFRNCEACKDNSLSQLDTVKVARRTANGHGR